MAYVLMSGKTRELNKLAINRMLLAVREQFTAPNIRLMVSDNEIATPEAMEICFPGERARGCYYHYGQVLYQIITRLSIH